MKKITMDEAIMQTSPQPVALISSLTPEGGTNLAAVCWWVYLESDPPFMGFSMWKESYTCELVDKNKKTVISIPGEAISKEAFECGKVSGRDVNKAEKYKLELQGGDIKYPVHSRLAFVCTVENQVDVGECTFFICRVDEVYFNENERQLFALAGKEMLATVDSI